MTLVDIDFTILARITAWTFASIGRDEVCTGGIVFARLRKTFVNVDVAKVASESWLAVAIEGAN